MKKPESWGQSAEVSYEASQRLHAENLIYAYIVGLFEGDGFFSVSKNGIYFHCEMGIELNIRDVELIYKIKNILGVGVIKFRKKNNNESVALIIRKKEHLINIMLPIFDKYPMFSKKHYDYLWLKEVLLSNETKYSNLKSYTRPNKDINTVESIISTTYFPAWLIGFIEAEGCFSFYTIRNNYFVASFDISQTNEEILILAIKQYLHFTTKVHQDDTNAYKLKVTSIRSIDNIIKFLNTSSIKLLGHKRLQYIIWLKNLRTVDRFKTKINIPNKY